MENIQNEVHSSTLLEHVFLKISRNWFMAACCVLMVISAGASFSASFQEQTLLIALLSLAPITGFFAMHLIIHRIMGHSCHQADHPLTTNLKAEPR